ncbi:MAG: hypothetical protein KUG79_09335 [Pseudomonadales bacterium]|nr:hypothetical protein [Pseudomonadales bacterium]
MKIRHIRSIDIWLLSKGNKILYRGKTSPWQSTEVIAAALRCEGKAVHWANQ